MSNLNDLDNNTVLNINGTGILVAEFHEVLEEILEEIGILEDKVSETDAIYIAVALFFHLKKKY